MKAVLQFIRMENRFNRWLLLAGCILAVVGAYFETVFLAAVAAAFVGVTGSGNVHLLEQDGSWEMMLITMPVSRKGLVLGRYLKSLLCSLMIGAVYLVVFRLAHNRSDDGAAVLLMGYSLVAAACSMPIIYTSWSIPGKQRGYSFCLSFAIASSRMATRTKYEVIEVAGGFTSVPMPISMEQGIDWLTAGLILMAVSVLLSLWLEPRREW